MTVLLLASIAGAGTWDVVDRHRVEIREERSADEIVAFGLLVRDVVLASAAADVDDGLVARASDLGWTLSVANGTAVLAEITPSGGGVYAFRLGRLDEEVVLQAPHPFFDLGTGRLVGDLFDGGAFRAACFATANRRIEGNDVAHLPQSRFQIATLALVEALPDPMVIQLHGYGDRTSPADAVLSRGSTFRRPERVVADAEQIATAMGWADVRTGEAVPELAGRRNVQGRMLADRGIFAHLELSRRARRQLRDADTQGRFSAALLALPRGIER